MGAVFKANDVFDSSKDLSQVIAAATMDRHPFFLDPQRSNYVPMEQQRWMIVERHAATAATPEFQRIELAGAERSADSIRC